MTAHLTGDILNQHAAVVGRTGSGKTYAAKGAVEWLLGERRRVCILDPTGVWHGLRSAADGVSPGFPVVVFGGEHGDILITEHAGEQLAEIIASRNFPCIVDISDFTQGQKHRFLTAFAATLYIKNRAPLHLIIDEADEVAPQNPLPDSRQMLHEFDRIVRRGRARGFRIMLISQRPAVLHKNVLTQASTLVAMRLPAPQDRKAIEEWVKGQADVDLWAKIAKSLPGLPRGEGWVWAPEQDILEKVAFPPIKTFDSSRAPEDGEEIAEPRTLAPVEVEELRALLAPPEPEPEAARDVEYIVDDEENHRLRETITGLEEQLAEARRDAQDARDRLAQIASIIGQERAPAPPEEPQQREDAPQPTERAAPSRPQVAAPPVPAGRSKANGGASGEKIPPTTRKILDAIHAAYPVALTFAAAAARAGASRRSSQYGHYERQVRASSEVQEANGRFRSAAGFRRPVKQMGDPIETWASRLPPSYAAMLRQVARASRPLAKEDIAARAGVSPTSSGLTGGLRELVDLALIERIDGDRYQLADGLRG